MTQTKTLYAQLHFKQITNYKATIGPEATLPGTMGKKADRVLEIWVPNSTLPPLPLGGASHLMVLSLHFLLKTVVTSIPFNSFSDCHEN